ncbi:MAG: protein kinase domain-containing protein, partial [Planctomycetota bacterium]
KGKGAGPTRSFDGSVVGPGRQIGPFRIEQELGRGGAGVVYLAHDTKLDRSVAIKSLPPEVKDNPKALSRFTREARVLASLNHPNIASIYDELEEAEGLIYLVLEYVPGQTLAERITKKPLKLEEALSFALQIAEAVAAAHEHDVIHRDLKPGNIKITQEGKVKVLDFGLAKVVGGEAMDQQTTITEPGRVIGTPAYMSPEQARGKPTDKRSDIWSFGCVLYEMLTATVPFKGETISDTLANILQTEPRWETLSENIPMNIRLLLRHCLEKEPRRRLRDIGDAAMTIEDTTTELRRSTLPTRSVEVGRAQAAKWSRRALPWFITGAAVTVLVLVAFIIGFNMGGPSEQRSRKSISGAAIKPINAIVVLPFENLSNDPEQEYFVDGMTDALSAELGKIKALRVISRTSAMHYKDTDKVIPEIAKELGVDAVIEGSVLKAGNDVRVTAQLVDGRTDAHLWSDNYTGTLTNILALQSQVTLAIARQIEAALTPEEERRIARTKSVNPEAYEAFLKSQFFYFKRTQAGHKTAIEYLEKAIKIDPNYAEAYARLAPAYWVPSIYGYTSPHESFRKAKWAADTAIGLDDSLSMAHRAAGWIALGYDWEWNKAEQKFNLAHELNPNDPFVYESLAWYFVVASRFEQAIEMIQTALKLDPLSLLFNHELAVIYSLSTQFEKAVEQHKNTLELDSNYLTTFIELAETYMAMSKYSEAITTVEKAMTLAGRTSILLAMHARACALQGRKNEAQTLLAELEKRRNEWEKQ